MRLLLKEKFQAVPFDRASPPFFPGFLPHHLAPPNKVSPARYLACDGAACPLATAVVSPDPFALNKFLYVRRQLGIHHAMSGISCQSGRSSQ